MFTMLERSQAMLSIAILICLGPVMADLVFSVAVRMCRRGALHLLLVKVKIRRVLGALVLVQAVSLAVGLMTRLAVAQNRAGVVLLMCLEVARGTSVWRRVDCSAASAGGCRS